MFKTALVSAKNRVLVGAMPFLMGIGLASAALAQDYTYMSQFGTQGSGNGQFLAPYAVAIDPNSHSIVVSEFQGSRVQIFNSAGVYLSQFGAQGTGNGQFMSPFGVAIDPTSHNIVVADAGNNRVQIFNSAGVYLSQVGTQGSGKGQFTCPEGVAIDPTSHNIVVADPCSSRVQIFNSAGVYLSQFGTNGNGNGQFLGPQSAAIDPTSHNIVVADINNNRVQIFNSSGGYLSQFGAQGSGNGQLNNPYAVAIDPTSHNIVVADTRNNRVQIFDSTGLYLSQFGTLGGGHGQFNFPVGIAIDPTSHNILVSDDNNRVQIFAPNVAPLTGFQYPVGPDGWNKRVHGFGSLNLKLKSDSRKSDPYAPHLGQDWNINTGPSDADKGKAVVAIADGKVLAINYQCTGTPPTGAPIGTTCESTSGWGVTILVEHAAPRGQYFLTGRGESVSLVYSNYAHLLPVGDVEYNPAINIQAGIGQLIKKGDPIGQVGKPPGGPFHLHFEILLQADPSTYRQAAGYGWDLTHYTDPSEFIDNNLTPRFGAADTLSSKANVFVHTYGDGSLSPSRSPQFLIDDVVPRRGVTPEYDKNGKVIDTSVDPCNAIHKLNKWRRGGCDYSDGNDLGYNGEIFWRSASALGTAKWIPTLPKDGKYQVSIFVPADPQYAKGLALYQINNSRGGVMDTFTIEQSSKHLFKGGVDVTSTSTIEKLFKLGPSGVFYGAWINVGEYNFTAGRDVYLGLMSSYAHPGKASENIAVDAVRFTYIGQ